MKQFDMEHIGIFDLNFETGEQYWSTEVRRILCLPMTGPIELGNLLGRVHPDDRAAVLAFSMEPFRGNCPAHRAFEHRVVDDNGSVRWIHLETGAAFRVGTSNDVVRVIGLVTQVERSTIDGPTHQQPRGNCRPAAGVPLAA
jgi:hypothetical protein